MEKTEDVRHVETPHNEDEVQPTPKGCDSVSFNKNIQTTFQTNTETASNAEFTENIIDNKRTRLVEMDARSPSVIVETHTNGI